MSTHASATVSAVFFLWLASRRTVMGGAGLVLLVLNASTNVLGAYLLQLTHRILAWLRIDKIAVVAGIAVVVLAIAYAEAVLHFELSTVSAFFSGREQGSFATIISQLLSPQSYVRAFTLWPGDPELLHEELIDAWPNEIGYLSVLQQAGWIFGGVYLAMLFRRIPGFRVLIGVALLHFAMTTIPLIIFLLVQWARDSAPNARQHGEYSIFRPHEN
jgi:hypothetical protein